MHSPLHALRNHLSHAGTDLVRRPFATLLCVGAAFLAATHTWQEMRVGAAAYAQAQEQLETQLPRQVLVLPFDSARADLLWSPERLAAVAALPGVADAYPTIELAADARPIGGARGERVLLRSRRPVSDPTHRPERLAWGRALSGAPDEVLLSENLYARMGGDPERPGALRVTLRGGAGRATRTRQLVLDVVGLVRGETSHPHLDIPVELARELDRWAAGRLGQTAPAGPLGLALHGARRRLSAARPFVRCTVFAETTADVEAIVGHLDRAGYQARHQLDDLRGLQQLAGQLTRLVALLALGTLAVAAVAVIGLRAQDLHARRVELGLMRAWGLSRRSILFQHLLQGTLIGLAALLAAAVAQLLFGGALAGQLAAGLGVDPSGLTAGGPWGPGWLIGLVSAVVLGGVGAGSALPAAWILWVRSPSSILRA